MKSINNIIKYPFYRFVDYILNSGFFREAFWKSSKDLFQSYCNENIKYDLPSCYEDLNHLIQSKTVSPPPIFITARFRSGSTFLWQLFRRLDGITVYYEPLNQNRWFLNKGYKTDPTHIGASNYDLEYRGLSHLNEYYNFEWTNRNLYMDEKHYAPDLFLYIKELITCSKGRALLQFNRVDFRLAWLKAFFPEAVIVFLYRHPRQQWMSIQIDGPSVPKNYKLNKKSNVELFYLIHWAKDLRNVFPFLEPEGQHPYTIHYYLWRLSFLFANTYADYSICYEDLVQDFKNTFKTLLVNLGINFQNTVIDELENLNKGSIRFSWEKYAPNNWYEKKEYECEKVLQAFFLKNKL